MSLAANFNVEPSRICCLGRIGGKMMYYNIKELKNINED